MKRIIDWDVDGLSVWCDGCDSHTIQGRCEDCDAVYDLESEWAHYSNDPYYVGPKPSQPRPSGEK